MVHTKFTIPSEVAYVMTVLIYSRANETQKQEVHEPAQAYWVLTYLYSYCSSLTVSSESVNSKSKDN